MAPYTATTTLSSIVSDRPSRSRFFEQLGLDYCCGGQRPVGEACEERGLDPATILAALDAYDAAGTAESVDLRHASPGEIVDHILERHHAYLRRELPRLAELSRKVVAAHGDREPRLAQIAAELEAVTAELGEHLDREERELFPLIAQGSGGASDAARLAVLEDDHQGVGESLRRIRAQSDGYHAPEWACNTFRAFYDGLRELEADIHEHVHEENNILFPMLSAGAAHA